MKYLVIVLAVAVAGFVGLSAQPQETLATNPAKWPPLSTTCNDVTGDGTVDLLGDILGVIYHHGTKFGDPPNAQGYEYSLLYDVNGGGEVDLLGDILSTVQSHGQTCSLVDTQVVQATVATQKYLDPAVAIADGYEQHTQDVGSMGIHMYNVGYQTLYPDFASQMTKPVGLVYTDANPDPNIDTPDVLIGVWYIIPNQPVCNAYGIPGTCDNGQPEGFAGPEDFTPDTGAFQQAWHKHINLCTGNTGTTQAWVIADIGGYTEAQCDAGINILPGSPQGCGADPCMWIADYGWMMHMYNFIPNSEGRFLRWNSNVPYTD